MTKLGSKRLIGLKKVELAPYKEDGAALTDADYFEIGDTVPDSFVITKADDTITEEFVEEEELAIEETITQKGAREVTWSTINVNGEIFQKIMGGTLTGDIWKEDLSEKSKEFTLRASSKNGITVEIPRVSIRVTGDLKFTKNSLSQLTLKGKQLSAGENNNFSIDYTNYKD